MLVNAKCAPHYIKTVLENARLGADDIERASPRQAELHPGEPESQPNQPAPASLPGLPGIRTCSGGAGGCPAGTHYMGIRPNGTSPVPLHLPVFAGTLRTSRLADL